MALLLTDIRKQLALNARSAAGIDDAKHFRPDGPASGVLFWVEVDAVEPSAMGRQRWTVTVTGMLLVQGPWDRSKQEKLDELVPLVWTALETDRTLGGFAQSMAVQSVTIGAPDEGRLLATYTISVEA